MEFEQYLSSEDKRNRFVELIRETKAYLQTKGERISKDELNSFIIDEKLKSKRNSDLLAITVIETLNRLEMILLGQMPPQEEVAVWRYE